MPIIVIVAITAIKDAIEDYRRTLLDLEVNNTKTQILSYWHNYNVVDENISLWRRMKKATSRGVFKTLRTIKQSQQKRKAKKDPNYKPNTEEDDLDLRPSRTVQSIFSNHEMQDLEISNKKTHKSRLSTDSEINFRSANPFDDNANRINDENNSKSQQPNPGFKGTIINPKTVPTGNARFRYDYWKNVRVGDFVRVHNNDEIPADLLILSTSDSDGACYVETKNLDGETNLKVRQALKCGQMIKHSSDCERAEFWIESEKAHANLYSFNGVCKWRDHSVDPSELNSANGNSQFYDGPIEDDKTICSEPISINNILLRGCSLRNTKWIIGVVLFTGPETKIMLNAGETPTKKSRISRELNFSVLANFAILFVICFISGLANGIQFSKDDSSIRFFEFGMIGGSAPVAGLITFWAAVILYQSLVPISLYISIEIVKTIQAFFIYSDVFMYYAPIDYPCTPKSWSISDDLGQIEYIFSDKTGTLTQNVMEFKKCTINGVAYGKAYTEALAGMRKREGIDVDAEGEEMRQQIAEDKVKMINSLRRIHDNPQLYDEDVTFVSSQFVSDIEGESGEEQQRACKHFMLALALCHSVVTEANKIDPSKIDYKAQSPDEAALVATARDLGFSFIDRTRRGVIVNVQGVEQEYQILNTLEFNSTRKRMSAIVKLSGSKNLDGSTENDRILLICKGADSVIYSRLRPNGQERLSAETALHLEQFAREGLRTLCIAQRELTPEEYQKFNSDYEKASSALENREDKMEEVADALERNLTLLGGTAIEDRLQEGVPQTIALLGKAGIKLWVLTGDKVETAINIGFSCNLLDNGMELLILRSDEPTMESVDALLTEYLQKYFQMTYSDELIEAAKLNHDPPSPDFAIIVDGDTLKLCLDDSLKYKFLILCKQCKSILCCRVSPAQKAAVVSLVKNTLDVMTLSIGDGANDVAMIQEADVGVGIAGEEGRQAVMSSDYAFGQFRFLARLLLVHGRWSYKRLAEMIPNFFYKNVVFTFALFWYGVFSSFDGAYLFEYTYVMFFNLAFTSLPVILMGFLDQDVEDRIALAVPQLYRRGILRLEWSQSKFWYYMIDGLYQSLVSFFFPYFMYLGGISISENGLQLDHRYWLGVSVCTIAVVSCNLYVLSNQYRWDVASLIICAISCLCVWIWTGIYSSFTSSGELYELGNQLYGSAAFWAVIFVGIIACMLPHYTILSIQKIFKPMDVDVIREQWNLGVFDSVPPISETNYGLTASNALEKHLAGTIYSLDNGHHHEATKEQDSMSPGSDAIYQKGQGSSDEEGSDDTKYNAHQKDKSSKRASVYSQSKRQSIGDWVKRKSGHYDHEDLDMSDEENLVDANGQPANIDSSQTSLAGRSQQSLVYPRRPGGEAGIGGGPSSDSIGSPRMVTPSYISFDTEQLYPESVYEESTHQLTPIHSGAATGSRYATAPSSSSTQPSTIRQIPAPHPLSSSHRPTTSSTNTASTAYSPTAEFTPSGLEEFHFHHHPDDDEPGVDMRNIRKSLEIASASLRNEQRPPRVSRESIRMSRDLGDDLTTAENLMRTFSRTQYYQQALAEGEGLEDENHPKKHNKMRKFYDKMHFSKK